MNNENVWVMLMNTMGESILVETLRSAAYFITRSSSMPKPKHHVWRKELIESEYCYYFVQGTGLDLLIQRYDLGYDPDELRTSFNYLVRHAS